MGGGRASRPPSAEPANCILQRKFGRRLDLPPVFLGRGQWRGCGGSPGLSLSAAEEGSQPALPSGVPGFEPQPRVGLWLPTDGPGAPAGGAQRPRHWPRSTRAHLTGFWQVARERARFEPLQPGPSTPMPIPTVFSTCCLQAPRGQGHKMKPGPLMGPWSTPTTPLPTLPSAQWCDAVHEHKVTFILSSF